jgi:hypothetical protein
MSELFDIPPSKSPRILWQERHEITCVETDLDLPDNRWQAMHPPTQTIVRGPTRVDALFEIARKLNLKLWNEE